MNSGMTGMDRIVLPASHAWKSVPVLEIRSGGPPISPNQASANSLHKLDTLELKELNGE